MLLRASGEREETSYDLAAVTDTTRDSGVTHAAILTALAEQTAAGAAALQETRRRATELMGEQSAIDAIVVASAFNGITRVADATGIPLDENTAETTAAMRQAAGLDAFAYGARSERYG